MKKALLVTTVSGFVPQFEMNNVKLLQNFGLEVHYAANFNMPSYGNDNSRLEGTKILCHQIDFVRSPFKSDNIKAYMQLKTLMKNEDFQLIHCHTPMGGVLARLAAHRTGTKPVIYTAHGFHFFQGAPLKNWMFYYPVEKFLSKYTDQQICINEEDFQIAKRKFAAKFVDYVPGVGIDLTKIIPATETRKKEKREVLGIPLDHSVLLSVGELIKRKNHETVIKAISEMRDQRMIYVICGQGELESHLKTLAKQLGVERNILFTGYRRDILELYSIADIFVFPSYQEGLPRALLEAMASGLPVICSNIRGSRDLMGNSSELLDRNHKAKKGMGFYNGGIMIDQADDVISYTEAIRYLLNNKGKLSQMGENNKERSKKFGMEEVSAKMEKIYRRMLEEI